MAISDRSLRASMALKPRPSDCPQRAVLRPSMASGRVVPERASMTTTPPCPLLARNSAGRAPRCDAAAIRDPGGRQVAARADVPEGHDAAARGRDGDGPPARVEADAAAIVLHRAHDGGRSTQEAQFFNAAPHGDQRDQVAGRSLVLHGDRDRILRAHGEMADAQLMQRRVEPPFLQQRAGAPVDKAKGGRHGSAG